jgi:hypothetical protein
VPTAGLGNTLGIALVRSEVSSFKLHVGQV